MAVEEVGAKLTLKDRAPFSRGIRDVEGDIGRLGRTAGGTGRQFSTLGTLASGARGSISLVGSVARTAAVGVGVLTGAAAAGGLALVNMASDAQEVESRFNTVFGPQGVAQVNAWSQGVQGNVHIATQELQDATAGFGVFGQAVGVAQSDLPGFSTALAQAGLDLASFNNESPEDTFLALRSGLSGEAEPLRRFGIFLSDASLNAFAAAEGISATTEEMTEQEKVLLRQRFILANLGAAEGDLARTAEGYANQQRSLLGVFRDIRVELGEALLPAVQEITPELTRGLRGVLLDLNDNLPSLQERTRGWAQDVVRLFRTIRNGRVDTTGFDEQIEEVFGTRFGGFLNGAIDLVQDLRTNIGELGTRQGTVQTIEGMFGAGAAGLLDDIWEASENIGVIWRDILVPAWQGAEETLGPIAGGTLTALGDALGWAADNAERLAPYAEALMTTLIAGSAIRSISRLAGAFRNVAGGVGAVRTAIGTGGGRGLLGALGNLARFLGRNPGVAGLLAAGTGVATSFLGLSDELGEAVDRAATTPDEAHALASVNQAREAMGMPTISQGDLMLGRGGSPGPVGLVEDLYGSRAAAAVSGSPVAAGSFRPVGAGTGTFQGTTATVTVAPTYRLGVNMTREDALRMFRESERELVEAVQRGIEINNTRGN
ncbi:hypothetical protein [Euzebya sp.]|uniref:hypothetical protein n=1 Tax=Euzebya sp. TaxID=1971409 RepID=UPI003516C047